VFSISSGFAGVFIDIRQSFLALVSLRMSEHNEVCQFMNLIIQSVGFTGKTGGFRKTANKSLAYVGAEQ